MKPKDQHIEKEQKNICNFLEAFFLCQKNDALHWSIKAYYTNSNMYNDFLHACWGYLTFKCNSLALAFLLVASMC